MMPISVLIKPASGNCNMRCKYCFYADEQKNREVSEYGMMKSAVMQRIVDQALQAAKGSCTFAFQGGEPTLRGLEFYREFVEYMKTKPHSAGLKIYYSLQTNGYSIDEEWAQFFAKNHFLVRISLDGMKEIHDRYRTDAEGKGTYNRVMAAIRLLDKYHVEYNVLTVVTSATARNAQRIYQFFKKNNLKYQQYIECLDPIGEAYGAREYSLTPERYETFLKNLFDAWYLDWKQGSCIYNRYFENLLLIMNGQAPESCNMCGQCSQQWVIEADGSVYPCDFYALDEWKLGNIMTDDFETMNQKREEFGFIRQSLQIPEECRSCKWYALCRNGCRRLRKMTEEGTVGTNYFCSAYKKFFEYAYERLAEIYWAVAHR